MRMNVSVTFALVLRSYKGVKFKFFRSEVTLTSLLNIFY